MSQSFAQFYPLTLNTKESRPKMVSKTQRWVDLSFVVTAAFVVFVCHTSAQLTVIGSEEVDIGTKFSQMIQHFPNIGITFFFQYEIKVSRPR